MWVKPSHVRKPEPLLAKRLDVLRPNFVESRDCGTVCYNDHIALKFCRHLGSAAADVPVKSRSDWESLNQSDWEGLNHAGACDEFTANLYTCRWLTTSCSLWHIATPNIRSTGNWWFALNIYFVQMIILSFSTCWTSRQVTYLNGFAKNRILD